MASSGHRRGPRRGAVLTAAGVLVAALAVAGAIAVRGGDGCGGTGYPRTAECVARAYVTRADPSRCDLVAPALLEEVTGARGAEARRICAASARRAPPPSDVRVLERESMGQMVVVELQTDGREGKLTLSRSGGRWRITSFDE